MGDREMPKRVLRTSVHIHTHTHTHNTYSIATPKQMTTMETDHLSCEANYINRNMYIYQYVSHFLIQMMRMVQFTQSFHPDSFRTVRPFTNEFELCVQFCCFFSVKDRFHTMKIFTFNFNQIIFFFIPFISISKKNRLNLQCNEKSAMLLFDAFMCVTQQQFHINFIGNTTTMNAIFPLCILSFRFFGAEIVCVHQLLRE